jgi:hypothetical protein
MLETREFDLDLAFAAAGTLRENVEDQRRPVEDHFFEPRLEVALLDRREAGIDKHDPGAALFGCDRKLFDLAAAEKERRIGTDDRRRRGGDDLESGAAREFAPLGCPVLAVAGRGLAAVDDADQQRARGALCARPIELENGQASASTARLTGRAGTTVEIACL